MGKRKIRSGGGKEEQKWKNRLGRGEDAGGGEETEERGKEREAKGRGPRGRKNRVAAVDVRFPSVIGAAEI